MVNICKQILRKKNDQLLTTSPKITILTFYWMLISKGPDHATQQVYAFFSLVLRGHCIACIHSTDVSPGHYKLNLSPKPNNISLFTVLTLNLKPKPISIIILVRTYHSSI